MDNARAEELGDHPSSDATARIRVRVTALTPGRPFNANETAPLETCAARATSSMVGLRRRELTLVT